MVRAIPVALLLVVVALVSAIKPSLPLGWAARIWYVVALRGSPVADIPEWIAHYLWGTTADRVPPAIASLEETIRTISILALVLPTSLLILVQLV